MIKIVGLGPSTSGRISMGAYRAIRCAPVVFVRTARHPAADDLAAEGVVFESMDPIYDSAETFEEVYHAIAQRVLETGESGDVVYAVPGHPLAGEKAVGIIIAEAKARNIPLEIIGSESFMEASLEALEIGFDTGIKIIDALSMNRVHPDPEVGNLIYQVYDRQIASEVKLSLMERYADDFEVTVVSGAGTSDQRVTRVPLFRLDRCECDHLTTVYVPKDSGFGIQDSGPES
jgi:tetrapyrrole methylase family protein/MazG family protein